MWVEQQKKQEIWLKIVGKVWLMALSVSMPQPG